MASFEQIKNEEEADNMFKILSLATFVLAVVHVPWHNILVTLARAGVPIPVHPWA